MLEDLDQVEVFFGCEVAEISSRLEIVEGVKAQRRV